MYQLVIVDDEDKIVEGIANLFPWEQLGFQVTWFSRPLKALEYVRQHKVDVLMSDIEMPEMNGLELCRQLQDTDIKIVFISSHQNYEYFRYAIQYRVEDYLLKPIKSGDILNCFGKIRQYLDEKYAVSQETTGNYYEQVVTAVKEYIKENAVVIDVGIHRNEDNVLCGDVDYDDVIEKVGAITPVPGGVGPMTRAMLMYNCVEAACK